MKKYIYVGGGFEPGSYTFLLPIIEGYIGKQKISVLFEKSEIQKFKIYLKNSNLKLNNYKIINDAAIINTKKIKFKYLIFTLIKIIKNINYFFGLVFNFSYRKNNFNSNFSHAFWDTCLNSLKDKQLKPSLKIKILTLLRLLYNEIVFENLVKSSNIKAAFLGHTVYLHRVSIDIFRKNNIPIIINQNYCLFDLPKFKESHWTYVSNLLFKKIKKK